MRHWTVLNISHPPENVMDRQTDKFKPICTLNFFDVGLEAGDIKRSAEEWIADQLRWGIYARSNMWLKYEINLISRKYDYILSQTVSFLFQMIGRSGRPGTNIGLTVRLKYEFSSL